MRLAFLVIVLAVSGCAASNASTATSEASATQPSIPERVPLAADDGEQLTGDIVLVEPLEGSGLSASTPLLDGWEIERIEPNAVQARPTQTSLNPTVTYRDYCDRMCGPKDWRASHDAQHLPEFRDRLQVIEEQDLGNGHMLIHADETETRIFVFRWDDSQTSALLCEASAYTTDSEMIESLKEVCLLTIPIWS